MKLLIVSCVIALTSCDVSHILPKTADARTAAIVKQELDVGVEGAYHYAYETENGIAAHEHGELKKTDSETPAETVGGEVQYTSPEGQVIHLTYTADQNGFQPQGEHLPTPPPIPEYILRSLQYIRDHPPPPEPANN